MRAASVKCLTVWWWQLMLCLTTNSVCGQRPP
jgi:hypothetical protein